MRRLQVLIIFTSLALALGCGGSSSGGNKGGGGGGGGATGNNVHAIVVDGGPIPTQSFYVDGVFTTVTVCVPGTAACQSIDHVLVDTGSYGLRVLSSAVDSSGGLTLTLPQESVGGNPVAECVKFADNSFLWGSVRTADVKMGGTSGTSEVASAIPIMVAGDAGFTTIPTACSSGGTSANSLTSLAAHGILGIGLFPDDCGGACATGSTPPVPWYYACPSTGCNPTFVPEAQQLTNPIAAFATDNNGVIVELPSIGSGGQATVSGSMVFGIGTQSNNALPSAPHVFAVNGFASFETQYKGTNYGPHTQTNSSDSYIDSGSNGVFFPDSSIASCTSPDTGFYCPTTGTVNTSATQVSADGTTSNLVNFSVANAKTLFGTGFAAFNNLGGTNANVFDWGLPFFFGRNVYSGIAGKSTPATVPTPYWAY